MSKTILKTLVKARARIADIKDWDKKVKDGLWIVSQERIYVSVLPTPKDKHYPAYQEADKLLYSILGLFPDDGKNVNHPNTDTFLRYAHSLDLYVYDLAIEMAAGAGV